MRWATLFSLWAFCMGCGSKGGGGGTTPGGAGDTGELSEDTGHDGSVPDAVAFPKPEEWYSSEGIMAAVSSGEISEGEATLFLLMVMFGDLDEVPSGLLTSASGSHRDSAHMFIPRVLQELDELPADEAEAILSYLEAAAGLRLSGDKSSSGSEYAPHDHEEWCRYARLASECVDVVMPMRPPCKRDEEDRLIRDETGAWVPSGCTMMRFEKPSESEESSESDERSEPWDCSHQPAAYFKPNAWALYEDIEAAVEGAYPMINDGLGLTCSTGDVRLKVLDTSTAYWATNSIYGSAFQLVEEADADCMVFMTATPPSNPESSWLTTAQIVQGTVLHELFHCGQFSAGHATTADWMREGTATWAEDALGHLLWPGVDTEHHYFNDYFEPGSFLDRAYDNVFPFAHLGDSDLGFMLTQSSDPLSALVGMSSFPSRWHEASVATWNREPAEPYTDHDRSIEGSSAPDTEPLNAESEQSISLSDVGPLSYKTKRYELALEVEIVSIEPASDPNLKISAILEGGSDDRVTEVIPDEPFRICKKAVGACHERDADDLDDISHLGIVTTNVDHGSSIIGDITLNTWAPRLHGQWLTTGFWSTANPSLTMQTGGVLSIDEEAGPDTFREALGGVSVYPGMGLDCESTGYASGVISSVYLSTDENTATGTLESTTSGGGAGFECRDHTGTVTFSGATPGVWIMGATGSPWSPVTFHVSEDTLTLTSASLDGVWWEMTLTRVSDTPS